MPNYSNPYKTTHVRVPFALKNAVQQLYDLWFDACASDKLDWNTDVDLDEVLQTSDSQLDQQLIDKENRKSLDAQKMRPREK